MANYEFFTDVTGKKIKVSDLQSDIPCYFSSSNAAIKVGSSVVIPSNGSAQTTLTFSALQQGSENITVTARGQYANGSYTNTATTTIKLLNALQGLTLTPNVLTLYTGETTPLSISATNNNAYNWGANSTVSLTTTLGSVTKTQGALSGTFRAPSSLNSSLSSQSVTVTATAEAGYYSTGAKSATAQITVRQAATDISVGSIPTIYVDETKTFSCSATPNNVYTKGVTISSGGTTNYYSASSTTNSNGSTTISISGKAAGSATLTLQSADGKKTKNVTINITAKNNAALSLSKTNTTLNPNQIDTIKITSTGCTVSNSNITIGDSSIATATIANSYFNITAKAAGTTTITVSGTPNTGYKAPASQTVNVTVKNISISVV